MFGRMVKRMKSSRFISMAMAAMFAASSAANAVTPTLSMVHASESSKLFESTLKSVSLGTSALSDPSVAGNEWNGTFVYFGNQGNYPICFRVLDKDSTAYGSQSVLLDSNYALSRKAFDESGSASWTDSELREYLNSEFLMGNFSQTERDAILKSVKSGADAGSSLDGDYIFLLDQQEASDAAYGYGNGGTLAKENMRLNQTDAEYVLRSSAGDLVQTVDAAGGLSSASASDLLYYAPALNINADNVAFTYPAEEYKPAYLAPVGAADDNYYKLTMKGGSGFSASRKDSEANAVPAGYGFLVDVNDMGNAGEGVNYSRISGMLVDANGRVESYGMLSDIAATGEVLVNVPSTTPAGDYTLYVFAEDVKSDYYDHATDYASNFAPIKVRVGDADVTSETAQKAIETQNEQKTEQVQKQNKKTEQPAQAADTAKNAETKDTAKQQTAQKQNTQKEPAKAVAHKINLQTDNNGKLEANAATATVGTVIVLTATPNKDYHFKEWQSNDVKVADDNKFTMPDKDVTVKAVFEKNVGTHAIKLGYMENSTVALSDTKAKKGTKIKIKCKPKTGYHFVKWQAEGLTNDLKNENPITFTMPDNDVTVTAICEPDEAKKYSITVKVSGQGSAAASASSAKANAWVNLTANPAGGWRFVRWDSKQVNPGGQSKFLMPDRDVTLTAVFERIPESSYAVSTVTRGDGGQLWTTSENGSSRTSFTRGEKVLVQTRLNSGYQLSSLKADGVDLTTDSRTGTKYFYMPDRNVTLTAVFDKEAPQQHEAYLVVSGDGDAWTQNSKGENVRYFAEGERVYIQTMSHNAEVDSIQSRDAKINRTDGTYDGYFDMPKGGATVYVSFKAVEQEYQVNVQVSGDGAAWTTDTAGEADNTFKAGERVYIQTNSNTSKLESIRSNDVAIGPGDGKASGYFDMPRGDVTVTVNFVEEKKPEPEPKKTYSVKVEATGDGSGWTTDANGNAVNTFEEGAKVCLQTVHNSADIKSISSDQTAIQGAADGNDGSFTMPAGNVTVKIVFQNRAVEYRVQISSTSGPGGITVINSDGKKDDKFLAGEKVLVTLEGTDVAWEACTSDDPNLKIQKDEKNRMTFVMPEHEVYLNVVTKSTAAPEPQDSGSGSGDAGDQGSDPASVATVTDEGVTPSAFDGDEDGGADDGGDDSSDDGEASE